MGYRYKNDTKNPIIYQMNVRGLSKQNLCLVLSCSLNTLQTYIKKPSLMRFNDIILLSGMFGMPPEELVYILTRNKPLLSVNGKWYIEEIRDKYKDK